MMNIRGRADCVMWAAALGLLLLGCGGSKQRTFGGESNAAGQAGQGPDYGDPGHAAGTNAAAGRVGGNAAAGASAATGGASTGGRELGEGGGSNLGGAGGTGEAGPRQTLSDYLPCDADSDCPVGFGDCITEVPFNAKDVSGATSLEIGEIIPGLSSAGVCTRTCTNAPESCNDLKLTDSRGEEVSFACQIVAVGQNPYPEDVDAFPVAVDLAAMAAGVPFGAICRPPFELDPSVPNSLCNECAGASSCGEGLCYSFVTEAKGTADDPGICLMPCGAKSSCPGGFVCTQFEDEEGESLGRFCKPVQGTCGACIDRDGDGRGIGQCGDGSELITPVDCDDGNPDAYFDPENMGHAFPASCAEQDFNCNGLSDETEQLSDPQTYGSAHCGACGVTCAGGVEHGVARCLEVEGEITCRAKCNDGWADCSDEPGCETAIDDPNALFYPDSDGDGFGDEDGDAEFACGGVQPEGTVNNSTDCNDADADVRPNADELCDGIDNDCDGSVDEPDATDAAVWYRDNDGDGYGDPGSTKTGCSVPAGFVGNDDDCDDADDLISPAESDDDCDGVDQDCDGTADDDYVAPAGCDATDSAHRLVCVDAEKVCQCVPSEGEDVPGDYADTNCDGFDGDIQGSIFVNEGAAGCSGADGTTPDNPCGDLQAAIDRAAAEGKVVIAARGTYHGDTAVRLADGVSIYGGFNLETGIIEGEDKSVFLREAGSGHRVVAMGANISSATRLFNIWLEAATPSDAAMGTYGLVCNDCTGLTLEQVTIVLQDATDGADGAPGSNGARGEGGWSATNEWQGGVGGGYYQRGGNGGNGSTSCGSGGDWLGNGENGAGTDGPGGTGGKGPYNGGNGGNGSGCATPAPASRGLRLEIDGMQLWLVDPDTTPGGSGRPGGGGAGGQGQCDYNVIGANDARGGGGGGGGGQEGFGGGKARAGGSSVGLVLFDSVGIRLVAVSITVGKGGKGGNGGGGGSGGDGGGGGKAWGSNEYGQGAPGGNGGGGCGGTGGSGGFAAALVGESATIDALSVLDVEWTLGSEGEPGDGGSGGAGDNRNAGAAGEDGLAGQSCNIVTVDTAGLVTGCQI
jgi:hypothetical protein